MAARARRVLAVFGHRVPHGERLSRFCAFGLQRGDVRGRRRRRRSQKVLQHPLAAHDRRGPRRVRGERQDAALTQQPAARTAGRKRDAPEIAPLHVGDAVVLGQPSVQERVIGGQQLEHAAVLTQDAVQKELRFPMEAASQRFVEIGKQELVRFLRFDVAEVQPLRGEVRHHRFRTRIRQHAGDVPLEHHTVLQLSARRRAQQLVVRNAAPEKKRQARGELEIADAIGRAGREVRRLLFDAEEKLRAHQHAFDGSLNAAIESALGPARGVKREQALDVLVGGRTPVRPPHESRENPRRARDVGVRRGTAHENPAPARRVARPFDVVRTADRHAGDRGLRAPAAHPRPKRAFVARLVVLDEGDAHEPWTGFHRDAELQRIGGAAPGACRRASSGASSPTAGSADARQLHPFVVHGDFDLVGFACCAGDVEFDDVVAVHGEVAVDRETAARADR